MATVPILNRSVDAATPRPSYQSGATDAPLLPRQPVGYGLENLGAGIDRASGALSDALLHTQMDDNEREAKSFDVQLRYNYHQTLFGDGTADNPGYLSNKGQTAVDVAPDAKTALAQARNDVMDGITNPRVKQLFETQANERTLEALSTVDRHVTEQKQVADQNVSEARMGGALQDTVASYNNPGVLQRSLAIINGESASEAKRRGITDPEAVAQLSLSNRSGAVVETIKAALAADDVDSALKTYQANAGNMTGPGLVAAGTALKSQVMDIQAQAIADAARAKFPNDPDGALKFIADNAHGKTRDVATEGYSKALGVIETATKFSHWKVITPIEDKQRLADIAWKNAQHDEIEQRRVEGIADKNNRDQVSIATTEYQDKIHNHITDVSVADLTADPRLNSDPLRREMLIHSLEQASKEEANGTTAAQKKDVNDASNDFIARIRADRTGVTAEQISTDPRLASNPLRRKALLAMLDSADNKGEAITDQNTKDSVTSASNEIMARITGEDKTLTAKDISADTRLDSNPRRKAALLSMLASANKAVPLAQLSQGTTRDLMARITAGPDAPDKITDLNPIMQAYNGGKLTREDYDWLTRKFTEGQSPDGSRFNTRRKSFVDRMKSSITNSIIGGKVDGGGDANMYLFEWDLDKAIDAARAAKKDPGELLDPHSPAYFGNKVTGYQAPLSAELDHLMLRLSGEGQGAQLFPQINNEPERLAIPMGQTYFDTRDKQSHIRSK